MSFLSAPGGRFSAGVGGLQRLVERGRARFEQGSSQVRTGLERAREGGGMIATRAREAVAGDGKPNIGADASKTALSVADAAKRLMLEQLHRDGIDLVVIREVAYRAVTEASEAGADVTAAAIGATSGAINAARAEKLDVEGAGRAAASGALGAAEQIGEAAAERVRDAIHRRERGLHLAD